MSRIAHTFPGVVLATLLAWGGFAHAQIGVGIHIDPRTGDTSIDAHLHDINRWGAGHHDGFIDHLSVHFGAPRTVVREYVVDRGWAPGDIYYACAIAYVLGRPCLEVIRVYEADRGQGWGVIAKRMGIKPGSDAFHRLKGHVGQTHSKWHGGNGQGHGPAGGPPRQAGNPGKGNEGGKGKGKGRGKD